MSIESATMPSIPNQLILFVGDYIQLQNNFYGHDSEWLNIIDIEPYDICVLSNGARVCASTEYIAGVLSAIQYRELKNA
jgi:hypothetical protein